ncbi:RNA-directed DNA polymerase, eukaryota [Tanacetum coccineum]
MGVDDWHEITRKRSGYRTKEDELDKISTSIFVTNFPESCSAKDLFQLCRTYGHVVDSYIPNKRSKSGKRFGFMKFINVFSVERLVSNLCTLWMGKFRLHANATKFSRPPVNSVGVTGKSVINGTKAPHTRKHIPPVHHGSSSQFSDTGKTSGSHVGSYVNAVNNVKLSSSPALVLDESCMVERDLTKHIMGKVKDITSISNLYSIFREEGFPDVKITYLGGMWVMIEFDKVATKENAMNHTGVKSWFTVIKEAADDFVSEDRIVWVDIEGVPLNAWSRATFIKIGKKWGEIMELEDNSVTSFGRKRVCVKTKQPTTILESFKIVVKESVIEPVENNDYEEEHADEYESEVNEVPETKFVVNSSTSRNSKEPRPINQSEDPFGIYELLNRENKGVNSNSSSSIPHPPGFTPEILKNHNVSQSDNDESRRNKELDKSVSLNAQVMNSSQDVFEEDKNESTPNPCDNKGGSVLGVMEDVIRIGQAMRYSIEGCINDLAGIIGKQGDDVVFR